MAKNIASVYQSPSNNRRNSQQINHMLRKLPSFGKQITQKITINKEKEEKQSSAETSLYQNDTFDVIDSNRMEYFRLMANRDKMLSHQLRLFIRRKSCECTACGGSDIKQSIGHRILLPSEIDGIYADIFSLPNLLDPSVNEETSVDTIQKSASKTKSFKSNVKIKNSSVCSNYTFGTKINLNKIKSISPVRDNTKKNPDEVDSPSK